MGGQRGDFCIGKNNLPQKTSKKYLVKNLQKYANNLYVTKTKRGER